MMHFRSRVLRYVMVALLLMVAMSPSCTAAREPAATQPAGIAKVTPQGLWPGADPSVVMHDGAYYFCNARRGQIEVWKSDRVDQHGQRATVWKAPAAGWNRAEIWAPEIKFLCGKWYIYYAASQGSNETHRMGVLEAETDNPQGKYIDRGMLYTGDDPGLKQNPQWAIDASVLEQGDKLFLVWSGWEGGRDVQFLFAAPMSDPVTVSGPRVKLCANDTYVWERVNDDPKLRGLHEGPAFLYRNGRIFLIYSCSSSWQVSYKLGMLWMDETSDVMNPKSWQKVSHPVFQSTATMFGIGHCSFTTSVDQKVDYIAYHSKRSKSDGWGDRVVHIQAFEWDRNGFPVFGKPGDEFRKAEGMRP